MIQSEILEIGREFTPLAGSLDKRLSIAMLYLGERTASDIIQYTDDDAHRLRRRDIERLLADERYRSEVGVLLIEDGKAIDQRLALIISRHEQSDVALAVATTEKLMDQLRHLSEGIIACLLLLTPLDKANIEISAILLLLGCLHDIGI